MTNSSVGATAPHGEPATGGGRIARQRLAQHARSIPFAPPVAPPRTVTRAGVTYEVVDVQPSTLRPDRVTVLLRDPDGALHYAFTHAGFERITARTPVFTVASLDGWGHR